jgi:hypothetical protein
VTVSVNTDSTVVLGSDAIVNYAGADLEVVSVIKGAFFPEFSFANNTAGTLELHGYTTTDTAISGTGTLATVVFKAKKNSGSSTISFTCSGGTTGTNLISNAGINILACSQINQISVTYTSSTTPTNTPTPTKTPTPTLNPSITATPTPTPGGPTATPTATQTPTPTPVPGYNTIPVCAGLATSISTAIGTPQAVTITCNGVDTDGYVNAIEFTFGDGTTQLVEKNIGGNGSLSTTHTYTTIGTLGVSCRVRDNNNVFSSVPDLCKKIIYINPALKSAGTARAVLASAPTETPVPVVEIISETPEPTIVQWPTPTPTPFISEEKPSGSRTWWIIGGAVIVMIVFILILKRRNAPEDIPPIYPPSDTPPSVTQ